MIQEGVTFQGNDKEIAENAIDCQREFLLSSRKNQVVQLLEDSLTSNCTDFKNQFQYIFVDANHEYGYVKQDTENAFEMLSEGKGVIIWHDYCYPLFPELTAYLDEV